MRKVLSPLLGNIFLIATAFIFLVLSTKTVVQVDSFASPISSIHYPYDARIAKLRVRLYTKRSNGVIDDPNESISVQLDNGGGTLTRSAFFSKSASSVVSLLAISSLPLPVNANPLEPTLAKTTTTALSSSSSMNLLANTVKNSETFSEIISGFVSGAALSTTKTLVKYPLDTATVRLQMPSTLYSISEPLELFSGSFRGIYAPLLSNIPGGAIFFAIKDATKSVMRANGLPKWAATCVAVGVANFPYWLIRNPSEVVKTRQQAGIDGYNVDKDGTAVNVIDAFRMALDEKTGTGTGGIKELYSGYWENIIYAYPADVIKFLCYESLSGGKKNIPPLKGAGYGAVATAVAQFFTTPLDVVRNRVMANTTNKESVMSNNNDNTSKEGTDIVQSLVQLGRDEGLSGLFAGATPRIGKAFLSGAIQFATYEETKQSIQNMLIPKK